MSRELGHGSEEMVRRVDAQLCSVRHRSEIVEYQVEQHYDRLGDQLMRLGFVMNPVINPAPIEASETPISMDLQAGEDVPEWARRDSNARPLAPEAVRAA